ncbi:EF-hand domain-containing protein [Bailinhaonella thermotolerans]|uniref:EF-hand domain-containing protein n=1 Tax=Bailinhaonella thermotolerans TaxID=1070861 RepID=A0A3A4AP70_9ACTN|nr:EF-hand domain-containing protein [Bailinhaonella thermotolerans]RJL30349.1 EF-hand domain-containing protein [Bailinhaonella thermotolerans]
MADTNEYAATFQLVDTDGDGRISAEEMQRLMAALGLEFSVAAALEAVASIDRNGDGRISLDEFATFMSKAQYRGRHAQG